MNKQLFKLGQCEVEVLADGDRFLGLGEIIINETRVRSGKLPIRLETQSFEGHELSELKLQGITASEETVRIQLKAVFRPLPVKLMRDHGFDPIHETGDWDVEVVAGEGEIDLVLKPASDSFGELKFEGFSYHYEYRSETVPLFYLLDKASWELDGDICGATVISQSSCSAPTVVFDPDTRWSTEGLIHWEDNSAKSNKVMTHNLPRWASHQSFDFQFKGSLTLLGVFERVDLIRTIQMRQPGKAELKTFDKYIFDQALKHTTPAKSILLNSELKTEIDQKNLWTWTFDEVADRARAEFGLVEEPMLPKLSQNYWSGFTIDTHRTELLPAAIKLGFKGLFIDNINKSAMTAQCPNPPDVLWNMCCGHEYEPAPELGGSERLKVFIDECKAAGIRTYAWTNNDQALSSPVNGTERDDKSWFVRMEDARLKYGGAYTNCFSILDFKNAEPRNYWVNCLKKIRDETGLDAYLFDSFYNLGFMPVSYSEVEPTTQWKEICRAFKELQDYGVGFMIESFGPFGSPQHGCPVAYAEPQNLFATYKVVAGLGYTTIPNGTGPETIDEVSILYRFFAHMTSPSFQLYQDGKRLDEIWTDRHIQALADYNNHRERMVRRFLQEDDQSVLWHDAAGQQATLWNFTDREVPLQGHVHDATTGQDLPASGIYKLEALHTYIISGAHLPVRVG